MNNTFENFYEFREPDVFLSKEFYYGKSKSGENLKFKYSVHPFIIIFPSQKKFLNQIQTSARKILINPYESNLSKTEEFLVSVNNSDFPQMISDGAYNPNIITAYDKIRELNFITTEQVYFSVKTGCITYNLNNEENGYFQKWLARILSSKYRIPNLNSIEHILNEDNKLFHSEFYVFKKFTEVISNQEIKDTILGVINSSKSIKKFPNESSWIMEDFSKGILSQLFQQYYISNFQQSMHDMTLTEILNYGKVEPKIILH